MDKPRKRAVRHRTTKQLAEQPYRVPVCGGEIVVMIEKKNGQGLVRIEHPEVDKEAEERS